jgi:hypothetical protein
MKRQRFCDGQHVTIRRLPVTRLRLWQWDIVRHVMGVARGPATCVTGSNRGFFEVYNGTMKLHDGYVSLVSFVELFEIVLVDLDTESKQNYVSLIAGNYNERITIRSIRLVSSRTTRKRPLIDSETRPVAYLAMTTYASVDRSWTDRGGVNCLKVRWPLLPQPGHLHAERLTPYCACGCTMNNGLSK